MRRSRQNSRTAKHVARQKPMKKELSASLGDEEKPRPAFRKEKQTFRGVSLVHDHRLD
jgi:hypothetical protein